MNKDEWINKWSNLEHQKKKQKMFNLVDSYIKFNPVRILDIGCGLASESELFQKKYNCELYLLDGDFETTTSRSRKVNYGDTNSMAFYSKIEDLKSSWNSRNMQYTFIDANNVNIDEAIKFDLIYSFESCGFHYPLSTYVDLIKKHSYEKTVTVFDIRKKTWTEQERFFNKIKILSETGKSFTTVLKVN